MSETQPSANKEQKNRVNLYRMISFVLFCVLVLLVVFYVRQNKQYTEDKGAMTVHIDSLSKNLSGMLVEYESLKTTNDTINHNLDVQKEKVQSLLAKMRNNEAVSYRKIQQYENEMGTLREIMRSYIRQIDSLNTKNQILIAENKVVKENLQKAITEKDEVAKERTALSEKLTKGGTLRCRGFGFQGLTKRDSETRFTGRIAKMRICFVVNENSVAPKGKRVAYLVIKDPKGNVMVNGSSESISIHNEKIPTSARRDFDYQGDDVEMCIFYDTKDADLASGDYTVLIYIDGRVALSDSFHLR